MTPIEQAARSLYYEEANDTDGFDTWPEWESHDNPTRDIWRQRVRSVLKAALDVDELAAMLARLRFQEDMPYVIARAVVAHLTKGNENDE